MLDDVIVGTPDSTPAPSVPETSAPAVDTSEVDLSAAVSSIITSRAEAAQPAQNSATEHAESEGVREEGSKGEKPLPNSPTPPLPTSPTPAPPPAESAPAPADPILERVTALGGLQEVELAATIKSNLQAEDPTPGLVALFQESPQAYTRMLSRAIEVDQSFAIQKLQELGAIPANLTELKAAPSLNVADPETLSLIPQKYHQVFQSLPPEHQFALMNNMEPAVRDYQLDLAQRAFEHDQMLRANEQREQQRQQQEVQHQAWQRGESFYNEQRQLAAAKLSSIPLSGDQKLDGLIHEILVDHAESWIDRNQATSKLTEDARGFIQGSEAQRLRQTGVEIQKAISQRYAEILPQLASVFDKARKYDAAMRQQGAARTEIADAGTQQGQQTTNRQFLDKSGKTAPDFKQQLANTMRNAIASQG